jgi:hypothetical protein
MIAVCELQCKGLSHEKVNSGFIYGLSIAFPGETILFYADPTHIEAIKYIIAHDKIHIPNIEYRSVEFIEKMNFKYFFSMYKIIKFILNNLKKDNINKLFLLSFNPIILFILN